MYRFGREKIERSENDRGKFVLLVDVTLFVGAMPGIPPVKGRFVLCGCM
jgi:hypothetical protein